MSIQASFFSRMLYSVSHTNLLDVVASQGKLVKENLVVVLLDADGPFRFASKRSPCG